MISNVLPASAPAVSFTDGFQGRKPAPRFLLGEQCCNADSVRLLQTRGDFVPAPRTEGVRWRTKLQYQGSILNLRS